MIIKKLQKNKTCPAKPRLPIGGQVQRSRGFVILFAVTIAAILLAIALGVANIAFREIKFSTSVKDSNEAFFAADTGIERALFNDKTAGFYPVPSSTDFPITGLGSGAVGCAKVNITKDNTNPLIIKTTIISKGYNNGGGSGACTPGSNSVEREIDANY